MLYGHTKQREYFTRIIENNSLGTSYIFSGKEGIGKRLFALYLAKYFFCKNRIFFNDCSCPSCQSVLNYSHGNIVFVDENNLKIDVIRQINELAYLTSGNDYRFIIMDNVHKLTKQAANAFLKTLEEAPYRTIFILITNRYEYIMPTIRSRCIKIPFYRLSNDDLQSILENLGYGFQDINNAIKIAAGSASTAIKYIDISKENTFINYVENKNLNGFMEVFEHINEKDALVKLITLIVLHFYDTYRKNNNVIYLDLAEYLFDLINKLDFNVNIEMIKYLIFAKIAEVINGK